MEKFEAIIWEDYYDEDEISIRIDAALTELEKICKAVIKKST